MAYIPKSKSDKWETPSELKKDIMTKYNLSFDPCPIDWKPTDADGLTIEWIDGTFVNPPYSCVKDWIKKASEEHNKNKRIVMLINAITDTKAFHQYIYKKPNIDIEFLPGRIKFINPLEPTKQNPNVKGSMLVIFKNKE
jgi:phage N-6-adenine-methyltransferase